MLKVPKLVSGKTGTGAQAFSLQIPGSSLHITVPPGFLSCSCFAKLYASFKAHLKSFSCEIFPDLIPKS